MKIYTALSYSISSDLRYYGDVARRVLMSYWAIMSSKGQNIRAIETDTKFAGQVFLDSGAFSAFTKGVQIDIEEYAEFAKKHSRYFSVVANLDVIGNHSGSMANQRKLESLGVSPIPVFHYGSDFGCLRELVSEYQYIALGGLVPHARYKDKLKKHLDRCYSILGPGVKTHLFGITSKWALERYPAYSADSTSPFEGCRRGTMSCLAEDRKIDQRTDPVGFAYMDKRDGELHYKERVRFMIKSIVKLEDYVTALWAKRGITWTD